MFCINILRSRAQGTSEDNGVRCDILQACCGNVSSNAHDVKTHSTSCCIQHEFLYRPMLLSEYGLCYTTHIHILYIIYSYIYIYIHTSALREYISSIYI